MTEEENKEIVNCEHWFAGECMKFGGLCEDYKVESCSIKKTIDEEIKEIKSSHEKEMNEKTENKLFEKYPKLFPEGRKVNPKHSLMCFGFECEDGWYWLIDKLCDRIQSYIDANNKKQVVVEQVKEKFGGLRFYCRNLDILINGMIWFAESLSYSICEECGELGGELNEKGYTQTLCLKCRGKRK